MKKILVIINLLLISGCKLPELSLAKYPLEKGKVRTDGFYYNNSEYRSFMLYDNGVFLGDFGASSNSIDTVAKYFLDERYTKHYSKVPYWWGLFRIMGDTIWIEHWEGREWAKYAVTKYSGRILNTSTLLINHPVSGVDTFRLFPLQIKPDSTNKFIN